MRPRKLRPVKAAVVKEAERCGCYPWKARYNANKKIRLTNQNEAPEAQVEGNSTATEKDALGISVEKPKENVKGKSEAAAPKPLPHNPLKEAPGEGSEVPASKAI